MAKTADFEIAMRGPEAYRLAQKAMDAMVRHKVWPTPPNYQLWLSYIGHPSAPLAVEIDRIADSGDPFTESVCEELAEAFLPKASLVRDTGAQLSRDV